MTNQLSKEKATEIITDNSFELFKFMDKADLYKVTEKQGYIDFITGLPDAMLNGVLDIQHTSEGIQDKIDEIMTIFKENKLPISWYVWPSSQPQDIGKQLETYGIAHLVDNPGMLADLSQLPTAKPLPDDVRVEMVTNDEMLKDWKTPLKVGFGISDIAVNAFYDVFQALGYTGDAPLRHYVGYIDDQPASSGTVYLGENGVAGIWNIATIPEARGKGLGTEITRKPLEYAIQNGYKYSILLASKMGFPIYQKLGFEEYCKVGYYAWSPDA